ncbi:hypothetical protein QTO34_016836 [Cnephaeus nilssonii]|uniref:Uncharacterized protein n=1 Tax=Cnephaeus nilssonii TaxID=3371016 RepID=A0AA40I2Z7_CNENI|nr:hypothetical protein QTO34_016836 [Eptesicus nilssonii]
MWTQDGRHKMAKLTSLEPALVLSICPLVVSAHHNDQFVLPNGTSQRKLCLLYLDSEMKRHRADAEEQQTGSQQVMGAGCLSAGAGAPPLLLPAFDGPQQDVDLLPQRPLLCHSTAMAQMLSSRHRWRHELSVPPAQSATPATPSPAPPCLLANRGHSEGPLALGLERVRLCPFEIRPFPAPRTQAALLERAPGGIPRNQKRNARPSRIFANTSLRRSGQSGETEKSTYVYMINNYDTMTGLDQKPRNQNEHPQKASKVQQRKQLKVSSKSKERQSLPPPMDWIKKSAGPWKGKNNIWAHRPRGKKNPVVYEEISVPKEND